MITIKWERPTEYIRHMQAHLIFCPHAPINQKFSSFCFFNNQNTLPLTSLVWLDYKGIFRNRVKGEIVEFSLWIQYSICFCERNPPPWEKIFGFEFTIRERNRFADIFGTNIFEISSIHPEHSVREKFHKFLVFFIVEQMKKLSNLRKIFLSAIINLEMQLCNSGIF